MVSCSERETPACHLWPLQPSEQGGLPLSPRGRRGAQAHLLATTHSAPQTALGEKQECPMGWGGTGQG